MHCLLTTASLAGFLASVLKVRSQEDGLTEAYFSAGINFFVQLAEAMIKSKPLPDRTYGA